MQSIFRLPWCSDSIAPKMSEKAAFEHARQNPVVDISMLNKLKRKESASPPRVQPQKKQRHETAASPELSCANTRLPVKHEREAAAAMIPHVPGSPTKSHANHCNISLDVSSKTAENPPAPSCEMHSSQATGGAEQVPPAETAMETEESVPETSAASTDMSALQEVIENEFNMQILMKHNELRLIEQELAKCQVALEQLRRCELRPYPGDDGPAASVSSGTGPATAPAPGYTRPLHAAPRGVTDGPYTRHYNQWLLRDPDFDSLPVQSPLRMEGSAPGSARSTRTHASARKSVSKPLSFPSRPDNAMQSIPNYPTPTTKEKGAPQVLRRSTDGQLVKLICNNCHRGNFSSIQGFLNHCRIAHKVDYKSHDAAAIDCGQLLDETESASLPPETLNASAPKASTHKPSVSRTPTAHATPARATHASVHPLNTTVGATAPVSHSRKNSTTNLKPIPRLDSAVPSLATSPLTPSPHIPHLSAYFAKHHHGGDLAKAAAIAKQKVDLGADDDAISPATEQNSPLEVTSTGARTVAGRNGLLSEFAGDVARPSSRKGYRQPAPQHSSVQMQRPRPSPLLPTHGGKQLDESMGFLSSPQDPDSTNLSPHTADSNPGLVSDHEDDDHSDSGEDAPHDMVARPPPLPVGARNCSDNIEADVTIENDVGRDGVVIRRNSLLMDDDRALGAPGSPSRKLGSGRRL